MTSVDSLPSCTRSVTVFDASPSCRVDALKLVTSIVGNNGVGNILVGVYVFKDTFLPPTWKPGVQGEAVGVSRRQSLEGAAIAARNSSTCFKDKELWRVSKGHMEGTMEYSSNPKPLCFCSKILAALKWLLLSDSTWKERFHCEMHNR